MVKNLTDARKSESMRGGRTIAISNNRENRMAATATKRKTTAKKATSRRMKTSARRTLKKPAARKR